MTISHDFEDTRTHSNSTIICAHSIRMYISRLCKISYCGMVPVCTYTHTYSIHCTHVHYIFGGSCSSYTPLSVCTVRMYKVLGIDWPRMQPEANLILTCIGVHIILVSLCTPMRGRFQSTTKAPTVVHSRCTGVHL